MRIIVELQDGTIATTEAPSEAASESAVADGGRGPDAFDLTIGAAAAGDGDAIDSGAPPEWLVDAVNRAAAADGVDPTAGGPADDAGAAPAAT